MFLPALILSGAVLPIPSLAAESLLRETDAVIGAAKTLRADFEIREPGATKGELMLKGALLLADRNRFRYEDETFFLKPERRLLVSDGKRIGGVQPPINAPPFPPLPEWHNDVLRAWLGRGGTFLSVAAVWHHVRAPEGKRPGADDGPKLSHVRLLPD